MFREAVVLPALAVVAAAQATLTQTPWGQCGGNGWQAPTDCQDGYYCSTLNSWYAQCIPGTTTTTTPTTRTTSTTWTDPGPTTGSTSSSSSSTLQTSTRTQSGSTAGPTLVSGWYWIRAVVDPNFHKYLQTKPMGVEGQAYIDDASGAGQFNVVGGQLVYNTGADEPLYMHVENPDDKTQRKLRTWFAADPTDYGTFAFQGDTLTWSVADISRQNNAAWLVCEGQELFVNTGAYAYQTPAGCADQTIHSYGGSTADV